MASDLERSVSFHYNEGRDCRPTGREGKRGGKKERERDGGREGRREGGRVLEKGWDLCNKL